MATLTADEEIKLVAKIQKLLELGSKNPNKEEAAAAIAKANELMLEYNITNAQVEQQQGIATGKREEARTRGGFYTWQRELWNSIAQLNYCLYWTRIDWVPATKRTRALYGTDEMRKRSHMMVGRVVNVQAAKAMANYLEQVIDRIVAEALTNDPDLHSWDQKLNGTYAHSFRVGMADELINKIIDRYHEKLAQEQIKEEKAKADASRAAAAGFSTSTALTHSSYVKSEREQNMDFVYGEGFSARQAARAAEDARRRREEQEAYTRWAAAHPEEARKQAEEAQKRYEKQARRYRGGGSSKWDKIDYGAYRRGQDAAKKVSIDPQVDTGSNVKRIGK